MPGSGAAPGQTAALLPADPPVVALSRPATVRAAGPVTAGYAGLRRPWVHPGGLAAAASGLIGLASGLYQVGLPSLWRDEAATIDAAHRPVPQILALLQHVDAVNGAYYLLIHPIIAIFGTSAAVIRLPSVIAMAVAAAVTTALGRRLARQAGLPAPSLTGLLAGLLFTAVPQVTRYAQDARSYALVTMLAVVASYLLVRAVADDRGRWWAGYGAVLAAAGLLNVFALLLVVAHGVTLFLTRVTGPAGPAVTRRQLGRWATAAGAALVVAGPVLAAGYQQRAQIAWVSRPSPATVVVLVSGFAGSAVLLVPVVATAACGPLAGLVPRPAGAVAGPALFAGPWLLVPAVILLAASEVHPVFNVRYVLYSQPALALLCAAGLSWLAARAQTPLARRAWPAARRAWPAAWLPSALIAAIMLVLLTGAQHAVRRPWLAGNDNLRWAAKVLAAGERRGDAVLYLPGERRIMSAAYPVPFRRLDDVALAVGPVASGTLSGTEVSAATLARRLGRVHRVWVIALIGRGHLPRAGTAVDREKLALIGRMHRDHSWRAGTLIVSLYSAGQPGGPV